MSLLGQLGSLEAAGLVRVAQVEPDLEYFFRHSLVQDAAYASLVETDRQRLHLVVGETIENLYPERMDEYAGMLAIHFQKAGQDKKAHQYFIKAGKAALEAYANREAEIQFRRALSLACCDSDRAGLLSGLGEALYRQSRFAEALTAWREAMDLYRHAGLFNAVARLYARSARVAWSAGDNVEALRLSKEGLEVVAGSPNSPEMAMLIHEAARSCYFNDMQEKAYHLCRKALKLAESFGDIAGQADTLATYGVLKQIPAEEALAALEKSVQLAESAGYTGIALRAYHNLAAITGSHEGGREASRQYFKKAAEMGRKRGVATEEHYSLAGAVGFARAAGNLQEAAFYLDRMEELTLLMVNPQPADFVNRSHRGALLWMQGDWEQSLNLIRTCYQEAKSNHDAAGLMEVGGDLVYALLELNLYGQLDDLTEIETLIVERIQLAQNGHGSPLWPYLQLTVLRARQFDIQAARAAFEHAHSLDFGEKDSVWRENYLSHAEAELAAAEGRYRDAVVILEAVVSNYARLDARWSWARTLHDWAEVHIRSGSPADFERARALLREAQSLYAEMDARRHASLMEERLKEVRTKTFKLALVSQRDAQELARAAQIQGSFLPEALPHLTGWDLAVSLKPARQTSGDFYDFIQLSNNRWGIVVADVADKGTAAALFMTSCRSLLRTYAHEYEMWPELVLSETNRRLLEDTRSGLFVTVFYGILDPDTGLLTYANAGHNPPFWLQNSMTPQPLGRTGTPLGIFDEVSWEQVQIEIQSGEKLIIYTDGITDSQNAAETLYGEAGFLKAVETYRKQLATQIRDGILDDIGNFVADAPQYDDITLMVLARNELA